MVFTVSKGNIADTILSSKKLIVSSRISMFLVSAIITVCANFKMILQVNITEWAVWVVFILAFMTRRLAA